VLELTAGITWKRPSIVGPIHMQRVEESRDLIPELTVRINFDAVVPIPVSYVHLPENAVRKIHV
jgi:hypothetical protein